MTVVSSTEGERLDIRRPPSWLVAINVTAVALVATSTFGPAHADDVGTGLRASSLHGPRLVAQAGKPKSRADALLDDDDADRQPAKKGRADLLLDDDDKAPKTRADKLIADDNLDEGEAPKTRFFGYDQVETAYTYARPAHWSKLINRLEVGAQGALSPSIKWKVSGRFDYNAIYDLSNFYPSSVRDDHSRFDGMFRETYVDVDAGAIDLRLGRQQIVWGEVVGLFFADVVSAKDLRESILPDFDVLRIPQWAARAEWFRNDIHVEAIWIPFPTIDRIGRPGGDFFPYPPPQAGYGYVINNEERVGNASHQNFGLRASILRGGWDVAGFAYRSLDAQASFFRQIVPGPVPTAVFTPKHQMITQYGATASKDFGRFLMKGEAVYTVGRNFNTLSLDDGDGVTSQNFIDYIVSVEVPFEDDSRLNAQFFQRRFNNRDANIIPRKIESGASLFWSGKWGKLEPQVLLIHSLNRSDYLVRPKLIWSFARNWRAVFGVDVFGGNDRTLFGQFDQKDRVYAEVRRSF